MLDSLLLFLFMASPAIIFLAWLVLLKRPENKVQDKPETTKSSIALEDESGNIVYRFPSDTKYLIQSTMRIPDKPPTIELSAKWDKELHEWIIAQKDNEDTRPVSPHEDSFNHEELWEAAGNIPRESAAQKQQIDKWVNEALDSEGEDYL